MITLRNKLYESLLDDDEELISKGDKETMKDLFYTECKSIFPIISIDNIDKECQYNNGNLKIFKTANLSTNNRTPDKYADNIFKGFAASSNIDYISEIEIAKYYDTKKMDSNKYSISKINKYPMNIKHIHWFIINSYHLLDYCKDIKINHIDQLYIYLDNDAPAFNTKCFEFFKSVKSIGMADFRDTAMFSKSIQILRGVIRNIDANMMKIHIGNILPRVSDISGINESNKQILYDFLDDLYKYNSINELVLVTNHPVSNVEKFHKVTKSKKSGYIIK